MVVLVGIAQWDKNRTHWPETHQAPIGPEESGGLKGSMQHWPVVYFFRSFKTQRLAWALILRPTADERGTRKLIRSGRIFPGGLLTLLLPGIRLRALGLETKSLGCGDWIHEKQN